MADDRDEATRATRLASLDAQQDARTIPAGAISPTHVTEDDIYIQFNARFRPIEPADDEEEEVVVEDEAAAVSEE